MLLLTELDDDKYDAGQNLTLDGIAKKFKVSDHESRYIKRVAQDSIRYKPSHSLQKEGEVVGAFGCLHAPFEHPKYLRFLLETFESRGVTRYVCLGDIVDNHAISYHESNSGGFSAGEELIEAREHLKAYYEAFPELEVCLGNHDRLPYRKAQTAGIPEDMLRTPQDIWKSPDGWVWGEEFWIDGVRYVHGDSMGKAFALACSDGYSTVFSHWHGEFGVQFRASRVHRVFGCQVGCGIDRNSYAMEYGKGAKNKPYLGCAVIRGGVEVEAISMPMELKKYKR